jgi:outer membrane protein TolC
VLQARQVLDTANAQIPDLKRQIGQAEDAINILLGNIRTIFLAVSLLALRPKMA